MSRGWVIVSKNIRLLQKDAKLILPLKELDLLQ